MIEIVVTCLLVAGLEWAPPPGWTIDKVRGGGVPGSSIIYLHPIACVDKQLRPSVCPEPDRRTVVTLRRSIVAGERAELPDGCSAQAVAPK